MGCGLLEGKQTPLSHCCTAWGPVGGRPERVQSILCQKLIGYWRSRGDYNFVLSITALNVHLISQTIPSKRGHIRYVKIDLSAAFGFLVESIVLKSSLCFKVIGRIKKTHRCLRLPQVCGYRFCRYKLILVYL